MCTAVVLIPAYCPEEGILSFVEQLKNAAVDVVIVDDGSPKEYQPVFEQLSKTAVVLHHDVNQGKGEALKTGMRYIHTHYRDCVVVTADADGQHLPSDILHCAEQSRVHPDHLVLGVRDFGRNGVPFRSYAGNRMTSLLFLLFTGRKLSDTQTGLRAFDGHLIPFFLELDGSRYEYEMNQLLRCAAEKIPFLEVPIETVYHNGNESSHYRPLNDSLRILRQFLLFSLSSLFGFLIDYGVFSLLSCVLTGTGGIVWANVLARIVSGTCNYEINRRIVFHADGSRREGLLKYAMLAGGILVLNTMVLSLLTFGLGMPAWLAKLVTEVLLFLVSWTFQKNVVFASRRKGATV